MDDKKDFVGRSLAVCRLVVVWLSGFVVWVVGWSFSGLFSGLLSV